MNGFESAAAEPLNNCAGDLISSPCGLTTSNQRLN
jgi:hypothetical protein